jgi:hypothetical protein
MPPRLPWFFRVNTGELLLFGLDAGEMSIFPIGSRHKIWNADVESVCCQSLSASSSKSGTSFRGVRWLHHSCASIERNMAAASSLLNTSASSDDNGTFSPAFLVAIRARNRIQHDLTSLRRLGTNPRKASQASVLNEICRLGLLIYSDLIIFVTPIQSGIRTKYARKLLPMLDAAGELSLWDMEEPFLT